MSRDHSRPLISIMGDRFMLPSMFEQAIRRKCGEKAEIRSYEAPWPDEPMEHGYAEPGMDGLKVARVLQNSLPEIPIVMYTMHYTDQLSAAALAAGAKQVISKSETGSLISTVRELLTPSEDAPKPAPAPAINSNVKELVFDTPITRTGT